ncbi:HD domain-containing phosphohydrolase [Sulfurimonas sp. C5]|uniref:HD-GYP domain-containing protein n=1 Tax=Sulfurimonas sp. C5 TaxID=3036947 RepID=UPI0024562687|nr:HD domain-containing phosphohydrolase [Sulfurimonas sp. C5]MDH4944163.1 HD domain-containing protein [Sulfurimonas sp. C5]
MNYKLNLREVTYALSTALDFVGIDDIFHGKRVAYMAAEVLKELKVPQEKIDYIIYAGMLHDCGVSSTDVHSHLVTELDWDNAQVHAIAGEELLNKVSVFQKYATIVRYHHTHWDALPTHLTEEEKELSNLIYLVDRVDALRAQLKTSSSQTFETIRETIQKYRGTMFSPKYADTFLKISQHPSFWFYLEADASEEYFTEWIKHGINEFFNFESLKEISLMFSAVVDAKSEFTSEHSMGVSHLARYIAELMELPLDVCEKIELAGLLHDLGKLRIADEILNKPAKLNVDERLKMNRHGFDSYIILRKIEGFKEIAYIASLHHETLDAQGYPYNLSKDKIPLEARIITVADIFQALVQNRPYRGGLDKDEAFAILIDMQKKGKLDATVMKFLEEHLEVCYQKALAKS